MKKLFVLMALAGLAAFQVGCGESAPPAKAPMTAPSTNINMQPMTGPAADAKKTDGDAAKDATATEGDKAPEGGAAADEEKKDEEPKKDE